MGLFKKLFGSHSDREIKAIRHFIDETEALEDEYAKKTDGELKAKSAELRKRVREQGEELDDVLPEAFALVRAAAVRVIGQRAFRTQIIGATVLHQGRISEMKTGEGKTLTIALAAYLNALAGKGVHVVTVNDYLARFHSEWMGKIYRFLGMSVGLIIHGVSNEDRRASYAADITYGTNNEFGFDYLRDNMAIYKENMVQRGHIFAIVDEVDSILIDEARTPLIISGQGDQSTEMYERADKFVAGLRVLKVVQQDAKQEESEDIDADYVVDEKARSASLTARGVSKAEASFGVETLTDPENTTLVHHINQALKARGVMQLDVDYVVREGEVIIVDEFTGRLMFGRRYSEGLHQAIEAKEHVKVERESKTLATITFQNYFRLYAKLSGLTGTALTEEEELRAIYKLDVIEIPTNKPMIRLDHPDQIYKNELGKFRAVIRKVRECHEKGQPVLVGTISIEKSELLSKLLTKDGIKHVVLNAKHHEREAEIVAQAGHVGAVTISTNMAGRGTDIMLGGNAEYLARTDLRKAGYPEEVIVDATGYADTEDEQVLEARQKFLESMEKHKALIETEADKVRAAGGLFIIGTERHESRRIDNQLRGRSGRQGDPGESRFFMSLEDDLMRLFGSQRITGMMEALGLDEDTPIEQKILTNAIERAQKNVESRNFQTRKHVLEYDDVMNTQRGVIYGQRMQVLEGGDMRTFVTSMISDVIERAVHGAMGEHHFPERYMIEELSAKFEGIFLKKGEFKVSDEELESATPEWITEFLSERASTAYEAREKELTAPVMRELEHVVLLRTVDSKWMDHIDAMHELRQGVSLRSYAQTDPVVEYKREGYDMFSEMINAIRDDTVTLIFTARVRGGEEPKRQQVANPTVENRGDGSDKPRPVRKTAAQKVGRNDPCPCGSGKKYKKCCGFTENAS